jgi:hypothetical protein
MAIEITEKMQLAAPVETAWQFILEPTRVVTCMPGAELVEQLDDKTYVGKVKIRLGAITTSYKGEVVFASIDEVARTIQITGQGRETGGGTARGSLDVSVRALEDGQSEMQFDIRVELTGKVMQMGGRMIKGVSTQLFKQFSSNAARQLEGTDAAAGESALAPADDQALAVGSLLGRTLWQAIVDFFKRLFGRATR